MIKIGNKKNIRKGFTLIESLVVITMMMVLVAVASVGYSSASKKTRDNRRKSDIEKIRTALEMFRQSDLGGSYPVASGGQASGMIPDYMDAWPEGPKGSGVGDTYVYSRTPSNYQYSLSTVLEVDGAYSVTNP